MLTEPERVASEYKVKFDATEIEYLKKVGEIYRLVDELHRIVVGPGPIYYPARRWMSAKFVKEATVMTIPKWPIPIGYPIDLERLRELLEIERLQARATAAK